MNHSIFSSFSSKPKLLIETSSSLQKVKSLEKKPNVFTFERIEYLYNGFIKDLLGEKQGKEYLNNLSENIQILLSIKLKQESLIILQLPDQRV